MDRTHRPLTSTDRGQQFISTFTLTPDGSGTNIERLMDLARPCGFPGALFPLIATFLIKPDVTKGLGQLNAALERRP